MTPKAGDLRIDINERYILTSDQFNFIISERYISEVKKSKGKEIIRDVAYDRTLAFIFQWLLDRMIKDSNAVTLMELKKDIEKAKEEIITAMGDLLEWKLKNYD